VIEGNADSQIVGSTLTDRIIKYDWSYDHYFTADDMAKGIKFGVSIYDPTDGSEMWHTWTVYPGDPNLTWTETGWEYIMPETIICDKNANSKHEQVLGNEYYTYYVDYTSTPAHVDIAGDLEYRNSIEIDNQRDEVSAYYAHAAVQAAIYKHGTLVTDAQGAKIIWEVQATIPKEDPNDDEKSANYWAITDNMAIKDARMGIDVSTPEKVMAAITLGYEIPWKQVPLEIRNNDNVMEWAVERNGIWLSYASDRIKANSKIVTKALKNNSSAWNCMSEDLKNDEQFKQKIFQEAPNVRYRLDRTIPVGI
jgi:hypothetical protein